MTKETLQEANKLNHAIQDLEAQIMKVENMHHCDNPLSLVCDTIGSITIASSELKDDILDMVLKHLSDTKDKMEDALRML